MQRVNVGLSIGVCEYWGTLQLHSTPKMRLIMKGVGSEKSLLGEKLEPLC